jgi:hypothetical protein
MMHSTWKLAVVADSCLHGMILSVRDGWRYQKLMLLKGRFGRIWTTTPTC